MFEYYLSGICVCMGVTDTNIGWLVGWLVILFYGVSNVFGSFNIELNVKQFSLG